MNRFIERAFGDPFAVTAAPEALGWIPAMEISESAKELMLTAELPESIRRTSTFPSRRGC
jgi:hypothetical protein